MDTPIDGNASSRSLDVIVSVDGFENRMKWPARAKDLAHKDNIELPERIKIKTDQRQGPQDRTNLVIVEGGREQWLRVPSQAVHRFLDQVYGRIAPYFAYRALYSSAIARLLDPILE